MTVTKQKNYWRVTVRKKPTGRVKWGILSLGKGIQAGRFKAPGKDWQTQYLLFPVDTYTKAEALAWARKESDGVAGAPGGNPGFDLVAFLWG